MVKPLLSVRRRALIREHLGAWIFRQGHRWSFSSSQIYMAYGLAIRERVPSSQSPTKVVKSQDDACLNEKSPRSTITSPSTMAALRPVLPRPIQPRPVQLWLLPPRLVRVSNKQVSPSSLHPYFHNKAPTGSLPAVFGNRHRSFRRKIVTYPSTKRGPGGVTIESTQTSGDTWRASTRRNAGPRWRTAVDMSPGGKWERREIEHTDGTA